MKLLSEIQTNFYNAIFNADLLPTLELVDTNRFSIYRDSILYNHLKALEETYPAVLELTGKPFFKTMAYFYLQRYPALSGNFNFYGENLSDFLKEYQAAAQFPYLPEVATLEWAYHCAHFAPNNTYFNWESLMAVPENRYENIVFQLQLSIKLLSFHHPIYHIWKLYCQEQEARNKRAVSNSKSKKILECCIKAHEGSKIELMFKLPTTGCKLLIGKDNFQVKIELLSDKEFELLKQLAKQHPLGRIIDTMQSLYPDFIIDKYLQNFMRQNYIGGFTVA